MPTTRVDPEISVIGEEYLRRSNDAPKLVVVE
jgi:hypothetical protein